MSDGAVRKPCIFCGSTENKLTQQHLFASRFRESFEGLIAIGRTMIHTEGNLVASFPSKPFTDTIGGVCKPCNNVWLNGIEDRVFPVIEPMMARDAATSLTPAMQLAIANWAVETVLVFDHLYPRHRRVPDSEYGTFYTKTQPLKSHVVWIGRTILTAENLINVSIGRIIRLTLKQDDALKKRLFDSAALGNWNYVMTYSIGYVVLQVVGFAIPEAVPLITDERHRSTMSRIWPVQGKVEWPPAVSIDTVGDIRALHDGVMKPPPY
jgi:hypothetical protein